MSEDDVAPVGESNESPQASIAPAEIRSDVDIDRVLPQLTNWGRWGAEDELGTLNFITPRSRVRAAALVRTGRTVSLAREISIAGAMTSGLRRPTYEMHRYLDAPPEEAGCLDFVGMIYHGFAVTHLDALCHIFTPEAKQGMYNGFPIDAVTPDGANKLDVQVIAERGIVGRGVVLDVAAVAVRRSSRARRSWRKILTPRSGRMASR